MSVVACLRYFRCVQRSEAGATGARSEVVSGCAAEWSGARLKERSQALPRRQSAAFSGIRRSQHSGAEGSQSGDSVYSARFPPDNTTPGGSLDFIYQDRISMPQIIEDFLMRMLMSVV